MIKQFGILALWLSGLGFVFAGVDINEPYLISLHGFGVAGLLSTSLAVLIVLIARACRNGLNIAGSLLFLLWCLPALSMLSADMAFEVRKQNVLQTDLVRAHSLGQHFIVGYSSFDEVLPLVQKGLIAGIYITRHNIAGRTAAALKSEISALQDQRRIAGLPPLMVAADQEGGIVSHLSPPLTALPALSTLAGLPGAIRAERAEEFGRSQGKQLAALGINQDFAPVLDLRPKASHNRFDFNTLISQRAISDDPATVAELGLAYVRGLDAFGVGATVKHFPARQRGAAEANFPGGLGKGAVDDRPLMH